jgi:hypothetical protein
MTRVLLLLAAGVCLVAGCVGSNTDREVSPVFHEPPEETVLKWDPPTLRETARLTEEKLATSAASWSMHFQYGNQSFQVDVTSIPPRRRYDVLLLSAKGQERISTLLTTPDVWYQWNHRGAPTRSRRSETVPDMVAIELFIKLSDPIPALQSGALDQGLISILDGVATMRTSAPLLGLLAEPKLEVLEPRAMDRADRFRRVAAASDSTAIDLRLGLVTGWGTPGKRQQLRNFRWEAPDRAAVDPPNLAWVDLVDDPFSTGEGLDRWVAFSHAPLWRFGGRTPDCTPVLLNLDTGRIQRIPFAMSAGMGPWLFTRDRRRVIGPALDPLLGSFPIVEVDLSTGENRIYPDPLGPGMNFGAVLSPDERYIAAAWMNPRDGVLLSRIILIDRDTGTARPIGEPMDCAFLSWRPDGTGLIMLRRDEAAAHFGLPRQQGEWVVSMDLDGTVNGLFVGSQPIVLPQQEAILHSVDSERHGGIRWYLRDLDGGNPRLFHDGTPKFGQISVSPDGRQLLLNYFEPGAGPAPMIVDIETGARQLLDLGPGAWLVPSW